MHSLLQRLALRVLGHGYVKGDATQTAFHELHVQIQTLRRERDHWKLQAVINKLRPY
jgi:hypothetical protein